MWMNIDARRSNSFVVPNAVALHDWMQVSCLFAIPNWFPIYKLSCWARMSF